MGTASMEAWPTIRAVSIRPCSPSLRTRRRAHRGPWIRHPGLLRYAASGARRNGQRNDRTLRRLSWAGEQHSRIGWRGHTISKPGFYYHTIMTFRTNYVHYDTIMTLLLHLSLLQKSDYYYTLWQNPGKHYYYTYDSSLWPSLHFEYIMTFMAIITLLYP